MVTPNKGARPIGRWNQGMSGTAIRAACEKLFTRYLKKMEGRAGVFVQSGSTMVVVETRQWKLSYSPMERVKFDLSDEGALFVEVPGDDNGVHLIPWTMLLRITVNEGPGAGGGAPQQPPPGLRFR